MVTFDCFLNLEPTARDEGKAKTSSCLFFPFLNVCLKIQSESVGCRGTETSYALVIASFFAYTAESVVI
jgi:hypothetical protein